MGKIAHDVASHTPHVARIVAGHVVSLALNGLTSGSGMYVLSVAVGAGMVHWAVPDVTERPPRGKS